MMDKASSAELAQKPRIVAFVCGWIQKACQMLRLSSQVAATAQTLLHRFYSTTSLTRHGPLKMAMGCVFLAAKLHEQIRSSRDVLNVFDHIENVHFSEANTEPIDLQSQEYFDGKQAISKAEMLILRQLGFRTSTQHPHAFLVCYLNQLDLLKVPHFATRCFAHLNDSFRLNFCVRFQANVIACALIFFVAAETELNLNTEPAWFRVFEVEAEDLRIIVNELRDFYEDAQRTTLTAATDIPLGPLKLAK